MATSKVRQQKPVLSGRIRKIIALASKTSLPLAHHSRQSPNFEERVQTLALGPAVFLDKTTVVVSGAGISVNAGRESCSLLLGQDPLTVPSAGLPIPAQQRQECIRCVCV